MVDMDGTGKLTQNDYGWNLAGNTDVRYGVAWSQLSGTSITVVRGYNDPNWIQVRMMIWIIQ
jgi:hypothetical protein